MTVFVAIFLGLCLGAAIGVLVTSLVAVRTVNRLQTYGDMMYVTMRGYEMAYQKLLKQNSEFQQHRDAEKVEPGDVN